MVQEVPGGARNYPYEDGGGFWGNDSFGGGYQQSYGGGPVRGGFGGPGRRPCPYSGMLHLLVVMHVGFNISLFHSLEVHMLVCETEEISNLEKISLCIVQIYRFCQ
jgi:hypothetical protein